MILSEPLPDLAMARSLLHFATETASDQTSAVCARSRVRLFDVVVIAYL